MARPRTPTNVLDMRGAFTHNPGRLRDRQDEPQSDNPLGPAPAYFNVDQLAAWAEIERIAPQGVLTDADRLVVEIAAHLLAAFRTHGAIMETAKIGRLESLLGRLGLSPVDRSKVTNSGEKKKANSFAANKRA